MKKPLRLRKGIAVLLAAMLVSSATASFVTVSADPITVPDSEIEELGYKNADFVFVIDSTGSMSSYIKSVKTNLTEFVKSLGEKGINLRMAVLDFRDVTYDGDDSTVIYDFDGEYWTSDIDRVIQVFDGIEVDGGGDGPETPTEAIDKALKTLKTEEEWKNTDNKNFMFLLTDADYKEEVEGYEELIPTMDAMEALCREYNIRTTVVGQTYYQDRYEDLYTLTGGEFIDINSSDYYEVMQEVATWVVDKVTDSDGDGIPDEWEINGVTIGDEFVNLPAMGADPNVPDIFIEVDWMQEAGTTTSIAGIERVTSGRDYKISPEAYADVYNAFKSAESITGPVNLHIDAGPDSIMNYETGEKWGDLSGANAVAYEDVFELGEGYKHWNDTAMDNFTRSRWSLFKYCLLVDQFHRAGSDNYTSTGIAEYAPGQFFIVATGMTSDAEIPQAGTFMHELGHTLGLSHGGLYKDEYGKITHSDETYKPNHISVMNYSYQMKGFKDAEGNTVLNYQPFDLPSIDEDNIDEALGIDPYDAAASFGYFINLPKTSDELVSVSQKPIDFNGDGEISESVTFEINPEDKVYPGISFHTETLNEWKNIKFTGGLIGGNGESVFNPVAVTSLVTYNEDAPVNELTLDVALAVGALGYKGDCALKVTDYASIYQCAAAQNVYATIENLYSEPTTVTLTAKSDALGINFSEKLSVDASSGDLSTKVVPIKVDATGVAAGTYNIDYVLSLASGKTISKNSTIVVQGADTIELTVGTSTELSADKDDVTWISSDESVVSVDGKVATAKAVGEAYVTATDSNGASVVYIIKTVAAPESSIESESSPESTTVIDPVSVPETPTSTVESATSTTTTTTSTVTSTVVQDSKTIATADSSDSAVMLMLIIISTSMIFCLAFFVEKKKD